MCPLVMTLLFLFLFSPKLIGLPVRRGFLWPTTHIIDQIIDNIIDHIIDHIIEHIIDHGIDHFIDQQALNLD